MSGSTPHHRISCNEFIGKLQLESSVASHDDKHSDVEETDSTQVDKYTEGTLTCMRGTQESGAGEPETVDDGEHIITD